MANPQNPVNPADTFENAKQSKQEAMAAETATQSQAHAQFRRLMGAQELERKIDEAQAKIDAMIADLDAKSDASSKSQL